MPTISFATPKGGAGKTTSAILLGTELAQGADVVLIDADPAARLMKWGGLRRLPERLTVLLSAGDGRSSTRLTLRGPGRPSS